MSPTWDLIRVLANIESAQFSGDVWRGHRQIYSADSDRGSRLSSGRYHQGPDCFPQGPLWPALYLALRPETAVLEVVRQYSRRWPPKNYRFSELHLDLEAVLDVRDPSMLGLTIEDLCDDSVDPDDSCFMRA